MVVDQPQNPRENVAARPCRQVEGSRTSIILEDNTAVLRRGSNTLDWTTLGEI
ncbi:hypothetical protein BDV11DRAFT_176678, partial [Aspergillus similis]